MAQSSGSRVKGSGLRVQDSGSRNSGFRDEHGIKEGDEEEAVTTGFRVYGLGLRV
jgi:hypothetical protein